MNNLTVRDPLARFESLYYYRRLNNGRHAEVHYKHIIKFQSPSFYEQEVRGGLDLDKWRTKDINECILGADKDAECNFNEPGINDKQESIVVRQYFSYVIIF